MKRYVSTSAKQYMSCYEQFAALDRLSKKQIWNAKCCADGHENDDFDITTSLMLSFPLTEKVMV